MTDHIPAGEIVRARPWDVLGAALAIPMLLWGFLNWFGTAGDAGAGVSGFYSGSGAVSIGLVVAASAICLNQVLAGHTHHQSAVPVTTLLSVAAALLTLGGMLAKPSAATIEAGSVAGLCTAVVQGGVLTFGWIKGSDKVVKAARVQAWRAEQEAADAAAAQAAAAQSYAQQYGYPQQYGGGYSGYTGYAQTYPATSYTPRYGVPAYGGPRYGQQSYGQQSYGQQTYPQQAAYAQQAAQQVPQVQQPGYGQAPWGAAPSSQPQSAQNTYAPNPFPQDTTAYPQSQAGQQPGYQPQAGQQQPGQQGQPNAGSSASDT